MVLLNSGVPVGSDDDVDELERAGESLRVALELPNLHFLNVDGNLICSVQVLCNSISNRRPRNRAKLWRQSANPCATRRQR